MPVVDAAVAYDCEYTGTTILLVIRNALHMRSMHANLIPPFMMRLAGIEVDECPKFLSPKPSEVNHSLYCPMPNDQERIYHLVLRDIER